MTQHITLNVKFSKSQLTKLKSEIKNRTEINQIFQKMWLVILMMGLIFRINY